MSASPQECLGELRRAIEREIEESEEGELSSVDVVYGALAKIEKVLGIWVQEQKHTEALRAAQAAAGGGPVTVVGGIYRLGDDDEDEA